MLGCNFWEKGIVDECGESLIIHQSKIVTLFKTNERFYFFQ